MALPNLFTPEVSESTIARINRLTPDTPALWGKMNAAQMLAHCNVTYELVYDDKHPKPGPLMGFILRTFIKKGVVNEKPYKRNSPTAPAFLVTTDKDFEAEKKRLVDHIRKTQALGEAYFQGRASHSFGVLSAGEWNNMFYKHLDHHLNQFSAT